MPRPGGPPSQRRPAQQPPQSPYGQYPQHQAHPPHSQHGHHPPQHQPFSPQEANALLVDLAGAAAAATLMLVLTCWLLSLGGAFAAGHVPAAASSAPNAAAAKH